MTAPTGPDSYRSIAAPVVAELEIKRSLFRCDLVPVGTEEAARAVIATARSEHPKARHHCSAFVLGPTARTQRSNDDGEPSGTAGAPMLDALTSAELSDVVAVVNRYFGGVLLGAGGLTRAYRAAVAEAVARARHVRYELRQHASIALDYATAALVEAEAHRRGWALGDSVYGSDVTLDIAVAPDDRELLSHRVAELSAGAAQPVWGATE
ncbi:MAG: IMPACT family protein, partial [Mycetocola sp.]